MEFEDFENVKTIIENNCEEENIENVDCNSKEVFNPMHVHGNVVGTVDQVDSTN